MNFALIEVTCPNCDKNFQAGKNGNVIEGEQYYVSCPYCEIRTQFIWGVFYGCLSYRLPQGVALLKPVNNKMR